MPGDGIIWVDTQLRKRWKNFSRGSRRSQRNSRGQIAFQFAPGPSPSAATPRATTAAAAPLFPRTRIGRSLQFPAARPPVNPVSKSNGIARSVCVCRTYPGVDAFVTLFCTTASWRSYTRIASAECSNEVSRLPMLLFCVPPLQQPRFSLRTKRTVRPGRARKRRPLKPIHGKSPRHCQTTRAPGGSARAVPRRSPQPRSSPSAWKTSASSTSRIGAGGSAGGNGIRSASGSAMRAYSPSPHQTSSEDERLRRQRAGGRRAGGPRRRSG